MDELIYYIRQLKKPGCEEDAYHRLLEFKDSDKVRVLIKIYHQENDVNIKSQLIDIIWHSQQDDTVLEFLEEVINHENPTIWKMAIDGLVAIGEFKALRILKDIECGSKEDQLKSKWIIEAINQIDGDN